MISKKANNKDATDYLLSSETNKKRLQKSIESVYKRTDLIVINLKDLKKLMK